MERDEIWKATALEGKIRIFVARTTDMIQTAANKHGTYPVATAALGRTLTAASILGVMSKSERRGISEVRESSDCESNKIKIKERPRVMDGGF